MAKEKTEEGLRFNKLPRKVEEICAELKPPLRLIAHLTLVHDVSMKIVAEFEQSFPSFNFDKDEVVFGAAIHDIGKALFPNELVESGNRHEKLDFSVLERFDISKKQARFVYTHANWETAENIKIEDLLVALADNCWKGKRNEKLEMPITEQLAKSSAVEPWEVFLALDEILQKICADADKRLSWQNQFSAV